MSANGKGEVARAGRVGSRVERSNGLKEAVGSELIGAVEVATPTDAEGVFTFHGLHVYSQNAA